MAAVIAVVTAVATGTSVVGGGVTIAVAALQVAGVAGSLAYQRVQQRKAKAAAARLKKEQAARARAAQAQFKKLSKTGAGNFESGTFSSAAGPRDITEMVRRSTTSRRLCYGRARLGGIWFYPETTGASNQTLHLILGLCEGPIQEIETVYFDDEAVTLDAAGNGTGKWAGYVKVIKHLGTPADPADPTLLAASTRWTANHSLKGIAYLYVQLTINLELWSTIPEISAVVKGRNDVYDPRTLTTGYSTNPALCLNHYLTTPIVGPGIASTDIDQAALINAANVCDEPVSTLLGTEVRYSCQGAIDLSSTVEDNAIHFVQAMNGDLIQEGGSYTIQAGEYVAPTFSIDLDMLAGPIEFSSLQPRRERANIIKGTFLSEQNAWQKFDFPSIIDRDAIAIDGQEVVADIQLELVGSGSQAQRLASMELRQARRGRTVSLMCNLKAMPARVGCNVMLDIPRYFNGDVFRVVEYKFSVGNDGAPLINLTLLENHPDIYEWELRDEQLINVPLELNAKSPQCSQPVMTPDGDPDPDLPVYITITTLTAGATIRYSFTAPPETIADGTLYTAPIYITAETLLYARAFRTGYLASPLALENYEV